MAISYGTFVLLIAAVSIVLRLLSAIEVQKYGLPYCTNASTPEDPSAPVRLVDARNEKCAVSALLAYLWRMLTADSPPQGAAGCAAGPGSDAINLGTESAYHNGSAGAACTALCGAFACFALLQLTPKRARVQPFAKIGIQALLFDATFFWSEAILPFQPTVWLAWRMPRSYVHVHVGHGLRACVLLLANTLATSMAKEERRIILEGIASECSSNGEGAEVLRRSVDGGRTSASVAAAAAASQSKLVTWQSAAGSILLGIMFSLSCVVPWRIALGLGALTAFIYASSFQSTDYRFFGASVDITAPDVWSATENTQQEAPAPPSTPNNELRSQPVLSSSVLRTARKRGWSGSSAEAIPPTPRAMIDQSNANPGLRREWVRLAKPIWSAASRSQASNSAEAEDAAVQGGGACESKMAPVRALSTVCYLPQLLVAVNIAEVVAGIVLQSYLPPQMAHYAGLMGGIYNFITCAEKTYAIITVMLQRTLKLEEQAHLAKQLEVEREAAASKQRFIRYVFHEARVPLHSVSLGLELLADELGVNGSSSNALGLNAGRSVGPARSDGARAGARNLHADGLDGDDGGSVNSAADLTSSHPANQLQLTSEQRASLGELVAMSRAGVDSMSTVINSVLTLSSIEDQAFRIEPVAADLRAALRAAKFQLQPWADNISAALELQIDPGIPALLQFDAGRIGQVLTNLGSNALKWVDQHGTGRVLMQATLVSIKDGATTNPPAASVPASSSSPEMPQKIAHIRIAVSDNGAGIAAEEQAKLFQPYHQIKSGSAVYGTGKRVQGTGLGLTIAREIVNRHGGSIRCESSVGSGSTFVVELRLRVAEENGSSIGSSGDAIQMVDADAIMGAAVVTNSIAACPMTAAHCNSGVGGVLPADSQDAPAVVQRRQRGTVSAQLCAEINRSDTSSTVMRQHEFAAAALPSVTSSSTSRTSPMAATPRGNSNALASASQLRFLVVDDVSTNRRLIARMLRKLWPDAPCIDEAADGAEAVEMVTGRSLEALEASSNGTDTGISSRDAAEQTYDVVLMDGSMPRMDGYDATSALRRHGYRNVIIGVTGNAMQEDAQRFIAAGAEAVLFKPVSGPMLSDSVKKHLESKRKQM